MGQNIINLRKSIFYLSCVLILMTGLCFGQSEKSSPSVDPERELIVRFQPGALAPLIDSLQGTLDKFQIASDTLRQILTNANVESVNRLIPDFKSEDRFVVNRTGESVMLTDWSNIYLLRMPVASLRDTLISTLKSRPEVVYAEVNGRGEPDIQPNDQYFDHQWALKNDGTAVQGSGTPGADIKVEQAWDITTGSSNIKIGIVDGGMQTDHPDFAGRVSGDPGDNDPHGTAVAGIAAAQGNNGIGIAGVAWNVGIINEDYDPGSDADFANALISAANRGADITNNSWKLVPTGRWSATVRSAFSDLYKLNLVSVASMGNQYGEVVQYPSAFGQGIITVGATTNTDVKADYSSTGNWIDVAAPSGGGFGDYNTSEDYIFSIVPGSTYSWFIGGYSIQGTSFSAPVASGVSALLLSYNPNLYNDDVEQIIRLGVDDVNSNQYLGFDPYLGTGRINARKALEYLQFPYSLVQLNIPQGWDHGYQNVNMTFYDTPGLGWGESFSAERHEIRQAVDFIHPFVSPPYVWGRGAATTGYSPENPNFGMGYCDVVPGTVTTTGCQVYTYTYYRPSNGTWYPAHPAYLNCFYTILGEYRLDVGAIRSAQSVPPYISVGWNDAYTNMREGTSWKERMLRIINGPS